MPIPEYFSYTCPQCSHETNAAKLAAALPDQILFIECARRNGRKRKNPNAGPGRPTIVRCPGCDQEMSSTELRPHRSDCVRQKLKIIHGLARSVRISPKDPDPYPNFYIVQVSENEVEFEKGSNHDRITVELNKIAEIIVGGDDNIAHIRVLGHIAWLEEIKRWRFRPSQIGRPRVNNQ